MFGKYTKPKMRKLTEPEQRWQHVRIHVVFFEILCLVWTKYKEYRVVDDTKKKFFVDLDQTCITIF